MGLTRQLKSVYFKIKGISNVGGCVHRILNLLLTEYLVLFFNKKVDKRQ